MHYAKYKLIYNHSIMQSASNIAMHQWKHKAMRYAKHKLTRTLRGYNQSSKQSNKHSNASMKA